VEGATPLRSNSIANVVTYEALIVLKVLITNLASLAEKALFMALAHVHEQLVVAEKAFTTELTQRVNAAFDGFLERLLALRPVWQ